MRRPRVARSAPPHPTALTRRLRETLSPRWGRGTLRPCLEVLIVGVFDGDGFDLELDANVFAADETAGIERLVPAHAEILPVDRRRGDERGALVSHRTGGCTFELDSSTTGFVTPRMVRSP